MDDVLAYNTRRWEGLVRAQALFTRPWLDLTIESARERLDRWGLLGDVKGKRVLCLAGGGGQQSVAFALLGAHVTVFDASEGQLARDREAATEYGLCVNTCQGDMRDLSPFEDDGFDIVWQPYSLNFVPDCEVVFKSVARILREGGLYHFMAANPYACGLGTDDWTGAGYLIRRQYIEGAAIEYDDESWVYPESRGTREDIPGPREYRQTLEKLVNALSECDLVTWKLFEWAGHDQTLDAPAGDWEHFTSYLPPWFWFWTFHRPGLSDMR
jgi:SAM-dependent methyltransferase